MRCPHDHRSVPVRGSYDVTAMCLWATGFNFLQICLCAELNKIVEATMPVNRYDDRKVSLWRLHGNGDLDVVRAWSEGKCNQGIIKNLLRIKHDFSNQGIRGQSFEQFKTFKPNSR